MCVCTLVQVSHAYMRTHVVFVKLVTEFSWGNEQLQFYSLSIIITFCMSADTK